MTRKLGSDGPEVADIGLGCMGMSGMYGQADEAESIATIHAAMDAGITLIDTADFYGSGHNEMLIRDALRSRDRDEVVLSVKFGSRPWTASTDPRPSRAPPRRAGVPVSRCPSFGGHTYDRPMDPPRPAERGCLAHDSGTGTRST
jgi:aryl-alcohol dehydrogenase-like predicted oxidoreductase